VFSERVSDISPNAVTATVWDSAATPQYAANLTPLRDALLAMVVGIMLGVGLAFVIEYLDDSWHSPEEAEQVSGVPTFGVIPAFGAPPKKTRPAGRWLADGVVAEAYRTLRTSLLYSLVDNPPKVITITSPGPREGKSTTCSNLAVVLAQAGKSVLLIECDFRKPGVHKIFELRNLRGVVDVLVGDHKVDEVWHEPLQGLKVMTAGPVPTNPAELLGSKRFTRFLDGMRREFDYVLIDAPPVQTVSDPMIIAAQGDGVLLVLDAQNTRKVSVRRSMRGLESVGANVIGTIMNNAKASEAGYGGRAYSYTQDKK
jgi:capsular exopolysaccharide synthesis family protein